MPDCIVLKRLSKLEAEVEESFLIGGRLDLVPAVSGSHPCVGYLRTQETAGHVPQIISPGVAGARRLEAYHLQDPALEEERIPRPVPTIRQDLDRGQPSRTAPDPKPQPIEPSLDG